jgi:N-acetylglucosaminyl-diphospho-decaprenol L-rhamnosyltransferase
MATRITVIIVTYNSCCEIGAALSALAELNRAGDLDCVVVDNRSQDRTAEIVRNSHPWVTLIESPVNLGYGRGLNLGMSRATTPYVLFMNPDAVIATPDIARLRGFLDAHLQVGLVAPAILEGDGQIQYAGVLPTPARIIASAAGGRWTRLQQPIVKGGAPFRTDWLCGALLLARRQVMEEIGGFDPRFFLYFEETDLCRRVLQRGYELWAVGEAVAFHVGSISAKKTGQPLFASCIAEHYFKSRFYYLRKYYGWLTAAATEIAELALLSVRSLLNRLRRRPDESGLAERMAGPFLSLPAPVAHGDPAAGCSVTESGRQ